MRHVGRWVVALPMALAMAGLAGCVSGAAESASEEGPATIEQVDGSELSRVILTAAAAKRLDIQTGPVRDAAVAGKMRKVVPYSAVLYDAKGETWAYTVQGELTYLRAAIRIESITGDMVVLADGPANGTLVVTVGAIELFGAELGVGK